MAKNDAVTKGDLDHAVEQIEAKLDGIKSWVTGVAFVAGAGIILSLASINIALITALK